MPLTPVDIEDNKINHYSLFFIEPDGVKTVRFLLFRTEGSGEEGVRGRRGQGKKGSGDRGVRHLRPLRV